MSGQNDFDLATHGGDVVWAPMAGSQYAFLSCPYFEVLYEGERGPGKTDALLMDFALRVGKGYGPAWTGILFRQTYKQLADVIAKSKKWFWRIWPEAKFNNSEHVWHWPTGERLLLRQFLRDDDYWNYHGHEYPWIGWEELCNWATPSGYLQMMSCCRSSNPDVPRRVRSTTNPYGPGHNWVKHRWRLPGHRWRPITDSVDDSGRTEPPRIAINGKLQENVIMLAADPGYLDRLRASARSEAELKAWTEGSWDIVAGGMFDDVWDPKIHVVSSFDVPHGWRIDRSFDWGSSKPFSVGWWAESDGSDYRTPDGRWLSTVKGDLFRIAEWYGWNGKPNQGLRMLAVDVAKGIVEQELKMGIHGRVSPGVADSSIFDVENGVSIAADMGRPVRLKKRIDEPYPGLVWLPADKRPGSRKTGWEMMRKRFKDSKPEEGMPREEPGLFVVEECDQFQRTVPVLPRDPKDADDVDTTAEDHTGDETRYRVRYSTTRPSQGRTASGAS